MSCAPVVLIIFNRPDFTASAMRVLAEAKPSELFIVADGPRRESEVALCDAARRVTEELDWDCKVYRNYAESNLGCYERVVSGLDWVFGQCNEAIILEDDMVPDPSLFPYSTELLRLYREDESIFTIGGLSIPPYDGTRDQSYSFTRYPLTWGWGTWARAWKRYDGALTRWPEIRETKLLRRLLCDPHAVDFYTKVFDAAFESPVRGSFEIPGWGKVQAWDFQWHFSCFANEAACVVPSQNLVSNVGFREDSTNVKSDASHLSTYEASPLQLPLTHPGSREVSAEKDAQMFQSWMGWRKLSAYEKLRFSLASNATLRSTLKPVERLFRPAVPKTHSSS